MNFRIPEYKAPDFTVPELANAPDCTFEAADRDGVAPEYFHSTSMFPEYFKVNGEWRLAEESRMDSSVVLRPDGRVDVVENRNIRKGDWWRVEEVRTDARAYSFTRGGLRTKRQQ